MANSSILKLPPTKFCNERIWQLIFWRTVQHLSGSLVFLYEFLRGCVGREALESAMLMPKDLQVRTRTIQL